MGEPAQLFFLLTSMLKRLFSKGFACRRQRGSDFAWELLGRCGPVLNQDVLEAAFCATEQRKIRFRHAKCMREDAEHAFVRSPFHWSGRHPHEESPVVYAVNTLARRTRLNTHAQHTVAPANLQPARDLGALG